MKLDDRELVLCVLALRRLQTRMRHEVRSLQRRELQDLPLFRRVVADLRDARRLHDKLMGEANARGVAVPSSKGKRT